MIDPGRRRAELAGNLAAVRARIAAACAAAGRATSEVTLIAVTKTFPASDVELLVELGIRDVGENRDQEAAAKAAAVAAVAAAAAAAELVDVGEVAAVADPARRRGQPAAQPVRWHFIGALQTNKCASVVRYASMVHSVDRLRLVEALASSAQVALEQSTPLDCLAQVDLDAEPKPGRAGARPADVPALAEAIATSSGLRLAGVMAVAPLGGDPREAFERLAGIAAAVRAQHPDAAVISAGMSGDLEAAVAAGATHLRVGAALLGSRGHPG